jgi:hypothetical protein
LHAGRPKLSEPTEPPHGTEPVSSIISQEVEEVWKCACCWEGEEDAPGKPCTELPCSSGKVHKFHSECWLLGIKEDLTKLKQIRCFSCREVHCDIRPQFDNNPPSIEPETDSDTESFATPIIPPELLGVPELNYTMVECMCGRIYPRAEWVPHNHPRCAGCDMIISVPTAEITWPCGNNCVTHKTCVWNSIREQGRSAIPGAVVDLANLGAIPCPNFQCGGMVTFRHKMETEVRMGDLEYAYDADVNLHTIMEVVLIGENGVESVPVKTDVVSRFGAATNLEIYQARREYNVGQVSWTEHVQNGHRIIHDTEVDYYHYRVFRRWLELMPLAEDIFPELQISSESSESSDFSSGSIFVPSTASPSESDVFLESPSDSSSDIFPIVIDN